MKLIYSLLLSSVLCVGAAQAAEPRNEFGILAGVDIAKIHSSIDALGLSTTSESATHFLGGLYAAYSVGNGFFIEPQIRFNQRGGSAADTTVTTNTDYLTLKYLDIPVYVKYKFANSSPVLPYVFAGPKFGFKIGSDDTTKDENGNVVSSGSASGAKTFDFSLDVGLGAEVAVSDAWSVGVTGAYSWGLTNLVDTDVITQKNQGFEVYGTIGMAF